MRIGDYTLLASQHRRAQQLKHNRRLISLRWIYITLLTAAAVGASVFSGADTAQITVFVKLGLLGLALNFGLWLLTRVKKQQQTQKFLSILVITQLLVDLLLASLVVNSQGGIESRATILYAIPIINAGVLFSKQMVFLTAVLSSLGYSAALLFHDNIASHNIEEYILPIMFYTAVFVLIAAISASLIESGRIFIAQQAYKELLSLLTHQLRHPISVSNAIIDGIEQEGALSTTKQDELLNSLKEENFRSLRLVNNILQTATNTPGRQEVFDLSLYIKKASHNIAMIYNRVDDLALELPTGMTPVKANKYQIQMVLDNIIDNAFRYSQATTPVKLKLTEDEHRVKLEVIDEGQGISRKQQKSLFKEFATSDSNPGSAHGAGLGLAVSKKITERNNGQFKVQSAVDKGTRIIISLDRG